MDTKTVLALQAAGVDTEGALRRFAGKSELYERFLLRFPEDETFPQVGPALAAGDWDAALRAAHTLKGVAANLGVDRLAQACGQVVTLLRGGQEEAAAAAYPALEAAYEEVCAALGRERRSKA